MPNTAHSKREKAFVFSLRDTIITCGILLGATELCILLQMISSPDGYFPALVFVLAVLLTSRLTNGYFYGLLASAAGVIGVNYIFTYPYLEFDFTISGYPLTFVTMLLVSAMTSALTTQIKKQERLRAESDKEKMRANLLRAVSHDIRTPLTSIVGATATILDNQDTLTEEQKRSLLIDVKTDAQWLIRVVENLLSITRIGSDRAEIAKEAEAAEEVVAQAVAKFRKRHPSFPVAVEVPEELLMVPMDAILIEQLLSNLLENVVLHAKKANHMQLQVYSESGRAVFSLRDNGEGIEPHLVPTLFDGSLPQNADHSVDGKRNMGIGLAVCMAIVRAHGGSMSAKNHPEGGAEFVFCLPLQNEEEHS